MTASKLDNIPSDILQCIAYHLALSSPPDKAPIHVLSPLLLTNSHIRYMLDIHNCPHLYANIFRATFDVYPPIHFQLTDSVLAAELLCRCRFLWRIQRMETLTCPPLEELRAAIRMVVENAGSNGKLLVSTGFPAFLMALARHRLMFMRKAGARPSLNDCMITSLTMWLLCLTMTHEHLVNTPEQVREEFKSLLRFPTAYSARIIPLSQDTRPPTPVTRGLSNVYLTDLENTALIAQATPLIILVFALNEVSPIAIPSHIPETRAIAVATHRSGPTVEDFRSLINGRTPLFADTGFSEQMAQKTMKYFSDPMHQAMWSRVHPLLYHSYLNIEYVPKYIPGSLAGVWEGSLMISGEPAPPDSGSPPVLGQFQCLKPMQCALTEYLCFSPCLPIPIECPLNTLDSALRSQEYKYEKFANNACEGMSAPRDPKEALDVIILGETLHDHDQAWDGFRFAGRVCSDGSIVMYREPKAQDMLGSWIFEGHLRYGIAFVGQWQSSVPSESYDLRGIFSLRKTAVEWQE